MRSLLLGAGNSRVKKVHLTSEPDWIGELTTLDMNPSADVVWDLEDRPLPFPDETFDELAAYDVLEHVGRQGDWRGWFDEMAEYHRILKPGGTFGIIVPEGGDALADPGHTRFFHQNHFGFLCQSFYEDNLAKGAAITDYRWYIKAWWEIIHVEHQANERGERHHLCVLLRKA